MRRRLLIVAAILMGVAAVATSLSPRTPVSSPTPTPGPAPSATIAERPSSEPELQIFEADRTGQVVRANVGETVALEVRSKGLASVQLGSDGPIEVAEPDSPARFELYVDGPLERPVTVLEDGRVIGRVVASG